MLLDHPEFGQIELDIIDAHFDLLFVRAQKLTAFLERVENPSLLDGLV